MKLSGLLISGAMAAKSTNKLRYSDFLNNIHEGTELKSSSKDRAIGGSFVSWEECPPLVLTDNMSELVCDEEYCVNICKSNSSPIPNGDNAGGSAKLRCKGANPRRDKPVAYWNKDQPKCGTCGPAPEAPPTFTDSSIDAVCSIATNNMKECALTCMNGGKINGKSGIKTKCICDKSEGKCFWALKKTEIDTETLFCEAPAVTTIAPGPTVDPEDSCATKDSTCTTLSEDSIKYSNSWTCRNCFRIRADYKFKPAGIMNWEDKDYLDISFKYKVTWITYGHPIDNVEDISNGYVWRVWFKSGANFVSGMMWDANLQTVQNQWITDNVILRGAASCPCSNTDGATPAPWN